MYTIWGKVIRGKNRGKKIGIPTANLRLHKKIPEGIYVSKIKYKEKVYKSVSFIGAAKTFGETSVFLETYIFDFNRNIYDEWISVCLLKKIRENKKFATVEELKNRIEIDKKEALAYFRQP